MYLAVHTQLLKPPYVSRLRTTICQTIHQSSSRYNARVTESSKRNSCAPWHSYTRATLTLALSKRVFISSSGTRRPDVYNLRVTIRGAQRIGLIFVSHLFDNIRRILPEELLCSSVMNYIIFKTKLFWFFRTFPTSRVLDKPWLLQDFNRRLQQVGTDQREMWLVSVSLDSGNLRAALPEKVVQINWEKKFANANQFVDESHRIHRFLSVANLWKKKTYLCKFFLEALVLL